MEWDMIKRTINNGHSERGIYEQFIHTSKLSLYPNSSDTNELSEIPNPL